ncbi:MAG: carbohydrate porin [Simkaniaceae bacterium]|nr:carbohydrate porin [Simkaniaceae bacterium]
MKNLILLLLPLALFASDSRYSQTAPKRHKAMEEHFVTGQNHKVDGIWNRKYLTGDWYGRREEMVKKGITVTSSYTNDLATNPSGGRAHGFTQTGSWGTDLRLDFEKICGLKGFEFYTAVVWRAGASLSEDKIGNIFPVQQVYGGQNFRVVSIYLQQSLFDDKLVIRGGRLSQGDTFLQSPLFYLYMNNSFDGNPISPFFNTNNAYTAYPNTQWGLFLKAEPLKRFLWKFGVYNTNNETGRNHYHGLNLSFYGNLGTMFTTELSYLANGAPEDSGYPGKYTVGGYVTTKDQATFLDPLKKKMPYMWYILAEQMIYRAGDPWTKQGLTAFANVLISPESNTKFPIFINGGLTYQGVFSRSEDRISTGVSYGKFSRDLRQAQRNAKNTGVMGQYGDQPQNFETVLELNYWAQVNKWWVMMPNIQYIFNPNGTDNIQDAFVIGLQVAITL